MTEHEAWYKLGEIIVQAVKEMSDEDIDFAYWLNYEDCSGYLEQLIRAEYFNRGLHR